MNDSTTLVRRDENGRLLPGSVLNPPGMRQGTRHFSTLFKEAIRKIDANTGDRTDIAIVNAVLNKAKKGDLNAIDIVREEIDGPLPKAQEGGSGNVTFNVIQFNGDIVNGNVPPTDLS
jgi:hypothetical protein